MKETEDNTNKWKGTPCAQTGRINTVHTSQSNIHIQCNPYQSANDIFPRIRPNNSKLCMKSRKTSYRQNNFEKEQSWRYFAPGFDL